MRNALRNRHEALEEFNKHECVMSVGRAVP